MGVTLTDVLLFGKAQSDDVDNATLVIYRRNILRWSALGGYLDIIVKGVAPLSLPDAIANSLSYVKAFGGTEQRDIPDNYLQRQFIYMMDGSYLLTDIVPSSDMRIEMDFQTTSMPAIDGSFVGSRDTASAGAGIQLGFNSSTNFTIDGMSSRYTSTNTIANNTRYKFTWNNGLATIETGGSVVDTNTFTPSGTNTYPLVINGLNNAGTPGGGQTGIYLYSFKVWNAQGELIANYVPAVEKAAVPVVGFYDTVSKTFKTATAGTFAAGGEAVPTSDAPMDIVSNNGVIKARHQSGLPLGYTLLDYIQSSGSQYIDTLRVPNNDDIIEQKFKKNGTNTATCSWYGSMPSSSEITPRIGVGSFNLQSILKLFAGSNYTGMVANADAEVHTLRFQATGRQELTYTLDGVTDVIDASTSATPIDMYEPAVELTSYLFARHGTNGVQVYDNEGTRIYYHREYLANGTLVLNMVPVKRNSDNVVGMYDLVSGQFFTNQGTGDFTAGDPVSDPVEIYTDGTVETIAVHSKNLFDKNDIYKDNYAINASGVETSNTGFCIIKASVLPSTSYTWSCSNGTYTLRIHAYDKNGNWISQLSAASTSQTATVTTTSNTYEIRFSINKTTDNLNNGQLERGSTATTYEPYYDGGTATAEMLLKVGDYQDVQEILSGAITRNVGVKVFDGVSSGAKATAVNVNQGKYYAVCGGQTNITATTTDLLSTHFKAGAFASGYDIVYSVATNIVLVSSDQSLTTVDSYNQWLADQYAAGTPVIFVYPLATPTTESVAGQTLQVTDGDNVLEITQASLTGLELEAEYQAAVSLTIQEVQDANLDPNVEVTIN